MEKKVRILNEDENYYSFQFNREQTTVKHYLFPEVNN